MPDTDTLDAHAFADACVVAPEVDPEVKRLIIDAYLAALHIHVTCVHVERALRPDEADALFRRAATASIEG